MKKINYSWETFSKDCHKLALRIAPIKFNFSSIYGVPRGGLIVAVILSHLLNLPIVLDKNKITSHTLIVDDISDTGNTLKKLLKDKKYGAIVTLWVHPATKVYPNYYINIKDKEWVVFPWETTKSSKYDKTI